MPPKPVQVTKSSELDEGTGQTEGMIRKGAIVNKSDKICASVMIAKPHSSSAVHHHGSVFLPTTLSINFPPSSLPPTDSLHREQDTVIYAKSGHGTVISNDGKTRQDLSPGDFALIPAWAEHQEVNDGDEEVEWIITRSGGSPVVVNLEGWGGKTKD